ncbi:DUF6166 domain-containing protein [Actinoplanes sp. URMC 104]|uniref:DUF6166 domain-containing protein n=1 Tax=Actinoplanes sp. URMC 104 TaxID=3423409 RepID=UPI003F1C85D7
MSDTAKWAYDDDRCYHGIRESDTRNRIVVEHSTYGPTERGQATPAYELHSPDPVVELHWGYDGSGPHRAAAAILTDALGWEPSRQMVNAFVMDWLSMASAEFWFRRPAILRWARGLLCQHGQHDLPAPLAELPPVNPLKYQRGPRGGAG